MSVGSSLQDITIVIRNGKKNFPFLMTMILLKSLCCMIRAELQRFCKLEIKQIISLSENQRLAMFEKRGEIKIFLNIKNKHRHENHGV